MSLRHGTGHLADELSEYAAGRLPDSLTLHWDRHLVACQSCRSEVEVERRLQAVLRSGPSVPPSLRTTLIAMGATRPMTALPTAARGRQVPEVPLVPFGSTPLPNGYSLPTVLPASPALHRSPLRSAVMATMVAGASAAAAWGLGVTAGATAAATNGVVRPTTTTAVTTTARTTRPTTAFGPGAQIGVTRATAPAAYHWIAQVAGLGLRPPDPAQSTP